MDAEGLGTDIAGRIDRICGDRVAAETEDVARVDDLVALLEDDWVGAIHQVGSRGLEERRRAGGAGRLTGLISYRS